MISSIKFWIQTFFLKLGFELIDPFNKEIDVGMVVFGNLL